MKRIFVLTCLLMAGLFSFAQSIPDSSWKRIYRETATRTHDLVHTKLELRPDFSKSWLYGKAWVTLKPHFYASDTLTLDAKGMEIKKITLWKNTQAQALKYSYDDFQLHIKLDKVYTAKESFTIYIEYTAKPNEYEEKYSHGDMLGIKGMYFINPKGEEKDKPTQIWTQGETESNSAWFPTIDKTNQKCTEELSVTVADKYVTLSNGLLISQKKNADGTRTDSWKMDLPHSPYLFFLGVGEYAVIKDKWRNKEVNYYVEPAYASTAKKIFGLTPEMINFFSTITGVDYPWAKYSQITGRDFVAGAMENTTATLHQESAQQDARELVDGNSWESTIAHELFHQWFGDYVTTESWSNITLNESFADYSQTLWREYKYGKDAGDDENYQGLFSYLRSGSEKKDLVRFYYEDKEQVFDQVSYQKGGCILHMLRNLVGDSAFFRSLNNYLITNKFKSTEAHQLRLAFEEVTGKDMNWFFNQWYFGSGNPEVDINYEYNDAAGTVKVIIKQTQKSGKIFQLPLAIDVYNGAEKTRHNVWVKNSVDSFTFNYSKRPDLVNVDGDKIMLWSKKDNKTIDNYIHQYKYAGKYLDRNEAIDFASKKTEDPKARELMALALKDKFEGLRILTINRLNIRNADMLKLAEPILADLAKNDPKPLVKAAAIASLGNLKKKEYAGLFSAAANDSSYTVAGNALQALVQIDPSTASAIMKTMNAEKTKGKLNTVLMEEILKSGDENMADKIIGDFSKMPISDAKFGKLAGLKTYLIAIKNYDKVKWGIDEIIKFREAVPPAYQSQTSPYINGMILTGILTEKNKKIKEDPSAQKTVDYIKSLLPADEKKSF